MAVKLISVIQNFQGTNAERLAMSTATLRAGSTFEEEDNNGNLYKWTGSIWFQVTSASTISGGATEAKQDDIIAALVPNSTPVQANLTLDGNIQQLDSDTSTKVFTVQAHPDNAANVYIGKNNVSDSIHMGILTPGGSMTFTLSNLNLIYIKGTAADKIIIGGEV